MTGKILSGVTSCYLLAPEVSALLHYMPDFKNRFLFCTLCNTGTPIGKPAAGVNCTKWSPPLCTYSFGEGQKPT